MYRTSPSNPFSDLPLIKDGITDPRFWIKIQQSPPPPTHNFLRQSNGDGVYLKSFVHYARHCFETD